MQPDDFKELLQEAKQYFEKNEYAQAEAILNQLILKNFKDPFVFHMLGTIFYDKGKFNKAIRSFRRALEIDPSFTDASVGLSIILNDLGRYEEGKKVFEEAKTMLEKSSSNGDPYIDEKLSIKHDELGEMYFQYGRHSEALEQYYKALNLSTRKAELTMKVCECYVQLDEASKAIRLLKELVREFQEFYPARLKLGKIYYDSHRVPEAIEAWESLLRKDPDNRHAREYLKLAQSVETIQLNNTAPA